MTTQRDLFSGEIILDKPSRRRNGLRRSNGQIGHSEYARQLDETTKALTERIASLEHTISELRDFILKQQPAKDSYSTQEIASILGRRPYTVREWCRLQRINAYKAMCGRGCEEEWRVTHEELCRIQNEGLLPTSERY